MTSRRERRLRRAGSLVLHLDRDRLLVEDFLRGRRFEINDGSLALLRRFDRWRTAESVVAEFPGHSPRSVLRSTERLLVRGLLVAEGTAEAARQDALREWAPWGPAGTYFHFATRNVRFAQTEREMQALDARVLRTPMPSIYKDVSGPRILLPRPDARMAPGPLGKALVGRRTCRDFLERKLPRRSLECVAALSFGRLGLIDGGAFGTLLHRSAPSAGARHPIECYVVARSVAGFAPGIYHYSVRDHALVRIREGASREEIRRFTWGQEWFGDAAAVFVLTAVFARTRWKYRTPQAYRVVLLDAAHACQNVLLAATSLGLGAFCTAALRAQAIDRALGLDGISEGSVYLAGVGVPATKLIRAATRPDGRLPGEPASWGWNAARRPMSPSLATSRARVSREGARVRSG